MSSFFMFGCDFANQCVTNIESGEIYISNIVSISAPMSVLYFPTPCIVWTLDMHGRWTSPHALQVFVAESDRCVGSEDPQGALSPSDVPPPSVKSDLGHRKRPAGVALSGTIADISPNP